MIFIRPIRNLSKLVRTGSNLSTPLFTPASFIPHHKTVLRFTTIAIVFPSGPTHSVYPPCRAQRRQSGHRSTTTKNCAPPRLEHKNIYPESAARKLSAGCKTRVHAAPAPATAHARMHARGTHARTAGARTHVRTHAPSALRAKLLSGIRSHVRVRVRVGAPAGTINII